MEHAEQISEEWSSLSGFYTDEEADFMIQLLSNCSVPQELYGNANLGISSAFWPSHESTIVSVTGNSDSLYFPSNAASTDSTNIFATTNGGNYSLNGPVTNFGSMSMGFSLGDAKFSPYSVQFSQQINENTDEDSGPDPGKEVLSDNNLQDKRDCQILVSEPAEEDKSSNMENSAKRSRSSKEISKNRRNLKSKKNPKSSSTSNKEEDKSHGLQGQNSSSCCSSDDDSSASQELNGGTSSCLSPKSNTALKSNGKSRSNRGAATDPQSLYARRRRERINERLRILQNLVPNGTKVDISTMLEEAVQYVKFLQLQIKLLSSDDLWMYAPIAYNGLNIGLDLNITATKRP